MNIEDFLHQATEKPPPGLRRWSIKSALDVFGNLHSPPYYQNQLGDVFELAQKIQSEQEHTEHLFAGLDWAEPEAMLGAIAPWVEEIRVQLAERSEASFPLQDSEAAASWIEETAEHENQPAEKKAEARSWELFREVQALLEELRELTKMEFLISKGVKTVSYVDPSSDWTRTQPALRGSVLEILADATTEMEKATGFSRAQLANYILTNHKPRIGGAHSSKRARARSYTLPESCADETGARGLSRMEVSITFRRPPTDLELTRVGKNIKEAWKTSRRGRNPSEKSERVVELINQRGEAPNNPTEWEALREQLAAEGFSYKNYRGPKIAWTRYEARLQRAR